MQLKCHKFKQNGNNPSMPLSEDDQKIIKMEKIGPENTVTMSLP